jgi:FMN phosphatase YigB (HAD superfamily)
MPIRAVVFDLFDTLVDLRTDGIELEEHAGHRIPGFVMRLYRLVTETVEVDLGDFIEQNRQVDAELRESRYARHLEVPSAMRFGLLAEKLGIGDPTLSDRLVETHMAGLRAQVREVDHHAGVLGQLASDLRVGLCSNFSHSPTARAVIDAAGLTPHLHSVVVSDDLGIRKPRAEIFRAVLDELGVSPDQALHVGDSLPADVGGAAALGIRTVWITRRVREPEQKLREWDGPAPDYRIEDLAELPELIDRADTRR